MPGALRPYQVTAVKHLQANPRAGLLLDMGLGKTAVCLTALRPEDLPVLVVAPKRVAENVWPVESAKWRPDLRVGVAAGSPTQRKAKLEDRSLDLVSIGQDNLGDPAVLHRQWKTFIVDELSGYKKFKGARWTNARRIVMHGDVENVWGLTGTPVPNGYEDLFGQIYVLDDGRRLGRTITPYRQQHFTAGRRLPNGAIIDRQLLPGHDKLINAKIDDICLAMRNDGLVDLPPVTWNEVEVPLPASVRKLYEKVRTELVLDLKELGISDYVHTAPTAAALSNRLSQVASGFIYQDPDDVLPGQKQGISWLHTERVKAVREIVEGNGGSPILLAYRYKPELEMLRKEFGKDLHTVKSPNVFQRWDDGQVPILAAHPGSIGHGLNLQYGGHTIVWMCPTWMLEHWDQFNARLPRSGQTHPVVIHMLTSPGTVDAKVYSALRRKDKVQKALLDHLESPV